MSASDPLFDLVHAMSKAEKRHFKLSAAQYTGGKNYLRLFDFLDRQRHYNETKIRRKFAGEKLAQHLPSEKNYLYRVIVQSLVQFHRDASPEAQAGQLIAAAQVLFEKKQYRQSQRLLAKAAALARSNESHVQALLILDAEEKFISRYDQVRTLQTIVVERRELLETVANVNDYLSLLAEIASLTRMAGHTRNAAQKRRLAQIMKHPLLADEKNARSLKALQSFHEIHCNYATLIGDYESVVVSLRRLEAALDAHPEYVALHAGDYCYIVFNLCIFCLQTGKPEETIRYRAKAEAVLKREGLRSLHLRLNLEKSFLDLDLRIATVTCRFSEVLPKQSAVREAVNELAAVEPGLNGSLRFNMAYALFITGKFKDAIKWLQPVIDQQQLQFRDYFGYMKAVLLRLLLHTELGNMDVIETHVRSLYRLLLRNNKLQLSEQLLLKFIRSLPDLNSTAQLNAALKSLHRRLWALRNDEFEKTFIDKIPFLFTWLISKTKKVSLQEAAEKGH